jgi:hypothetical protein
MYLIRDLFQAERGNASEVVASCRMLDQIFEQVGYKNRRVYVDYAGPMDTVVYQFEVESLDKFFAMERPVYVDPDERMKGLIDTTNTNAKSGHREIYEVIQ